MPNYTEKEIEEGRFFAVISYISFLCIISLSLKRNNRFALLHAKQGLVLFVLEVATFIISIIPFVGAVIKVAGIIIFTLLSLLGILQALTAKEMRIPVISDIADKVIL
jgi:uncharacterized membrane protein